MMKQFLAFVLSGWFVLCFSGPLQAQFTQVLYHNQALDTKDSLLLEFDLPFTTELWASNYLMVETTIQLYKVKTGLLEYLIEKGRYDIQVREAAASVRLSQKLDYALASPAVEEVRLKLYIPDTFQKAGEGIWLSIKRR